MKRLLFIAYHFPPHGGAGVQRSLKFVKYLPDFGIEPTVLTSSGVADRSWVPEDETLAHEIPSGIEVVRVPWPDPSQPDNSAVESGRLKQAADLVRKRDLQMIFVSMSPFSDASFASILSANCRIPWIADLRDPWALDEFQAHRSRWHRALARRQMRRALDSASLIVMNTPEAVTAFRRAFPDMAGHRVISITNGYDAADFDTALEARVDDRFTIVHAGFLHATTGLRQRRHALQYRLLGRLDPGVELLTRSHFYLLQALEQWLAEEPAIVREVALKLIGEPRPIDRQLVERSSAASLVCFAGYLSHQESVRAIRQADLLFLPLHQLPVGRRATIVPGKTYEYLATARPILAAVPEGDARDFILRAGTGVVCAPNDVAGILRELREQYDRWKRRQPAPTSNPTYVCCFERYELTRQLAAEIDAVTDRSSSTRSHSPTPVLNP